MKRLYMLNIYGLGWFISGGLAYFGDVKHMRWVSYVDWVIWLLFCSVAGYLILRSGAIDWFPPSLRVGFFFGASMAFWDLLFFAPNVSLMELMTTKGTLLLAFVISAIGKGFLFSCMQCFATWGLVRSGIVHRR